MIKVVELVEGALLPKLKVVSLCSLQCSMFLARFLLSFKKRVVFTWCGGVWFEWENRVAHCFSTSTLNNCAKKSVNGRETKLSEEKSYKCQNYCVWKTLCNQRNAMNYLVLWNHKSVTFNAFQMINYYSCHPTWSFNYKFPRLDFQTYFLYVLMKAFAENDDKWRSLMASGRDYKVALVSFNLLMQRTSLCMLITNFISLFSDSNRTF